MTKNTDSGTRLPGVYIPVFTNCNSCDLEQVFFFFLSAKVGILIDKDTEIQLHNLIKALTDKKWYIQD